MPFTLLDEPLDYIFAEHFRQRTVCNLLRHLAERRFATRAEADSLVAYLTHDVALHHADETDDLFPLVRRRAVPEDELGAVLARLGEDHVRCQSMIDGIVAALTARPAADPVRLDKPARELMQAYAAAEHRHLAMENGVVLAIARVRLTPADLRKLSAGMKARRGVGH
jgi:hemerythrin-like domain-containing protein